MYFSTNFSSILYTSSVILVAITAAAPFCPNTTNTAGGGLPNSEIPILISDTAVKEFQLALYLENLEASYFQTGLKNVTLWGTNGHPNDTIEIISKIAAVSS